MCFFPSLHPSSLLFAAVFPLLSLVWIVLLRTNIWISQYLGKCFVCSSIYVWMLRVASFKATHSFPYNMPLREAADLADMPSRPTWQVPCEMEAETCALLVRRSLTGSHKLAWKGPHELILFLSLLRVGSNTSLPFLTDVCLTSFWSPAVVQTSCSWSLKFAFLSVTTPSDPKYVACDGLHAADPKPARLHSFAAAILAVFWRREKC